MLALEVFRSRAALRRRPGGRAAAARALVGCAAPLRLVTIDEAPRCGAPAGPGCAPGCPGICGSDLGVRHRLDQPLLLRPGVAAVRARPRGGRRAARRLRRPARRHPGRARPGAHLRRPRASSPAGRARPARPTGASGSPSGHLAPGLQTGFCADTGGGWGQRARRAPQPAAPGARGLLDDEQAVLVEPLACAVHTGPGRAAPAPATGCWSPAPASVGLFAMLALRELTPAGEITVVAKHAPPARAGQGARRHQVVAPGRGAARAYVVRPRRLPGAPEPAGRVAVPLLGGVDVAIDAVGSRAVARDLALRATRAGGRVVLSGMPPARADLSPAWFRELEVVGSYASARRRVRRRPRGLRRRDRARRRRRRPADRQGVPLPVAPVARGARPRPLGRPTRHRQGRLRPARRRR